MNPLQLLAACIAGLPDEVKAVITERLDKMQADAKKTKLPIDDIGVWILRACMGL